MNKSNHSENELPKEDIQNIENHNYTHANFSHHQKLQQILNPDAVPFYQNFLTCAVCQSLQASIQAFVLDRENLKAFEGFAGFYCTNIMGYSNETCALTIKTASKELQASLFNLILSKDYFCSKMVPACTTPYFANYLAADYKTRVLVTKPSSLRNDDYINNLYSSIQGQNGRSTYSILHISDPHVDYNYKEGASTDCKSFICCHQVHGTSEPTANSKGDKECDTPS